MQDEPKFDSRAMRMTAINAILSTWLNDWLKSYESGATPRPLPKGYFGSGSNLMRRACAEARMSVDDRLRQHHSWHESTCYEFVRMHLPSCIQNDAERIAILEAFVELLESLQRGEQPTANDRLLIAILRNVYEAMHQGGCSQRYSQFMYEAHKHLF